jgi:hypothetical protein
LETRASDPDQPEPTFGERLAYQLTLVLGLGSLPGLTSLVVPDVPLLLSGSAFVVSAVFAGVIAGVQLKTRRPPHETIDR